MLLLSEIENTFILFNMVAEVVCLTGGEKDDPGSQLTSNVACSRFLLEFPSFTSLSLKSWQENQFHK